MRPTLVVVAATVALGVWAEPWSLEVGPRTPFSAGHLLAVALGRAQVALGGLPVGVTPLLAWPEGAAFQPILWPMQAMGLVLPPLLTIHLVFALTPAFNALGGHVLGRVMGLDPWGRAALAGLCAWPPWVRETLANGQIEQAVTGAVALTWALGVWGTRWRGLWMVPWMVVFAASAPHLALGAAIGLLFWQRGLIVLGGAAAGMLVAGAYHAGNFAQRLQVFAPKGSAGHPTGLPGLPDAATFRSLFVPPDPPLTEVLHPPYLGWVLVVGAVVGLRARPRIAVAAGVLISLAFAGPFQLLGMVSESLRSSSSPYRMIGAAVVALAALGAARVRGPVAIGMVAALWMETALVGTRALPYLRQDFHPDSVLPPGEGPVLDLPLVGGRCPAAAYHYALEATRRLRPSPVLVRGMHAYPALPDLPGRLGSVLQSRPCGEPLARLVRETGFSTVVLHRHDRECQIPPVLHRCLGEAFGEGRVEPDVTWWDLR